MCKHKCWQINRALWGGAGFGVLLSITQYFCCFARQKAVSKTAMGILHFASEGRHLHPSLQSRPPLSSVWYKHFTGIYSGAAG